MQRGQLTQKSPVKLRGTSYEAHRRVLAGRPAARPSPTGQRARIFTSARGRTQVGKVVEIDPDRRTRC